MKNIYKLAASAFAIHCLAIQINADGATYCANLVATNAVIPAYGPTCYASVSNEEEWHYQHEHGYTTTTGSRSSPCNKMEFDPDAKHKRFTYGPLDPDDCINWTDDQSNEELRLDNYYNDVPCYGEVND